MNRFGYRYISCALILALLLSALLLFTGCTKNTTIEAGQSITPADLTGDENAAFGADFDPDCVNHAGKYTFSVISGDKTTKIKLTVKDTVAPTMQVKQVYWAVGTEVPDPKYFVASLYPTKNVLSRGKNAKCIIFYDIT